MGKVFISYSHDSAEHRALVLAFSNLLREYEIDAVLDQYEDAPLEGWPKWMAKQIKESDFVIIICTERYWNRINGIGKDGIGKGVYFESTLAYHHIYYDKERVNRFISVLFDRNDFKYVPSLLKGFSCYCVNDEKEAKTLYRKLKKEPTTIRPNLGQKLKQMPIDPKAVSFASSLVKFVKKASEASKPDSGVKEERHEPSTSAYMQKATVGEEEEGYLFPAVREKLGDDYDFEVGRIGTGTYSKVYLGHHYIFEEDHALKIMDFDFIIQVIKEPKIEDIKEEFAKKKERFEEKVRFFNKFRNHSNILNIVDSGFVPYEYKNHMFKIPYMLSKFIKSVNLREYIQEEGPLKWENIYNISEKILSTIDKFHEAGYFYWNVKPEKILIEEESKTPVLLDAAMPEHISDETDFSGTNVIINKDLFNTRIYLSPFTGTKRERETASVICLFGVLLYEMVTGDREVRTHDDFLENLYNHLNTPGFTLKEKNPGLPEGIENIIKKAISRNTEQRYKDLKKILADLKNANESPPKNKEE